MNTITRRIATTAAALALAGSAVATSAPAQAAKPAGGGGVTAPLPMYVFDLEPTEGLPWVSVSYVIPNQSQKTKIRLTCTLDGATVSGCADTQFFSDPDQATYFTKAFRSADGATVREHTFSVTVIAGKTTYVGTTTFSLAL